MQHFTYEKQVEYKINKIIKLFKKEPDEVIKSPKIYYYRNRMDYAVGPNYKVGLKEYGKWYSYVDIYMCFLQSEKSNEIKNKFREFIKRRNILPWDTRNHTGFIRYIVIREGKFTGERMVNIITYKSVDLESYKKIFMEFLEEISEYTTSFYWTINDSLSDVSFGKINYLLFGESYIKEKILDNIYYISPNSFFQPNSYTAEYLLKRVVELLDPKDKEIIYDLYSGAGFYTVEIGKYSIYTFGVDFDEENMKIFNLNKKVNNVNNVKFLLKRVEDLEKINADKVVVDPPRAGLNKKVIKLFSNSNVKKIVYVSCNPYTQKRDIDLLEKIGYKLTNIIMIDQFPHTFHIETIVTLEK